MSARPRHAAALAALLAVTFAEATWAERADRDQPTLILGDRCVTEELKQIIACTGNVVLTRGTLRITGEQMEVRETPEGYRSATVLAAPGQLATFRQRRDPARPDVEEFFEGTAERIEYDERSQTVRLIQRAAWKRVEDGLTRDEVAGGLIIYDGRTSTYSVAGAKDAGVDGRARLILAPRPEVAPAPAAPVPLAPAPALRAPAPAAKK